MTRQNIFKGSLVLLLLFALSLLIKTQQVAAQVSSWEASYFNNPSLEGQPVIRTFESSIDHEWGTGAPTVSSAMPADSFSVRWIGQIVENNGRDYRLTARADDNIRVYVNADMVIDNWTASPGALTSVVIGLGRGTHTIRVEYREWGANAYAHFSIDPASSAPPPSNDPPPSPPPSNGECVIPDSGPWPPCATEGGGSAPPPSTDGCVIPATGPWPPCATEGGGTAPQPAPPSIPDQPIVISGDLRAYYAFDEISGAQVGDSAGNNTGSISAEVSRIDGPRNKALHISSQGSVFIPSADAINISTQDFSVGMWVRVSKTAGVQRLFDKRSTSPSLVGYHLFTWDGKLGMQLADGNGSVAKCKFDAGTPQCTNYRTDHFIADGQWHFVMVTVDRDQTSGLRFYVDNSLVTQMNPTDRQGSLNSGKAVPFVLDAQGAALDIDELYLYGRALSSNEISQLFHNR